MSALKKTIISHNISHFLENNLLVFFFNYNHMSIEEWRVLKNKFSKINKVNTLVVKNKIANKIVKKNSEKNTDNTQHRSAMSDAKREKSFEKVYTLFQGPTFLIGINSPEQSKQIFNILKKEKKLIFVGGLYQDKQINHLDLDHLLQLEKGVHTSLVNTLQSSLQIAPLTTQSINLYYLLKCYQNKKSLET